MARARRHFSGAHRQIQAAALGVLAGLLSVAQPAGATGTSGSIRLSGHVPARAAVQLSRWTLTPVAQHRSGSRLRLGIAGLSILANNRSFTVSLVSAGARGRPGLVEAATGRVVPYDLAYGGVGLAVVDGEVPLDGVLQSAAAGTGGNDIELRLRPDSVLGQGRYQDRLVLIIRAR